MLFPPNKPSKDATPVLYVPGHEGYFNQGRSIASRSDMKKLLGKNRDLDVFTLHLRSEPVGLDGYYLGRQGSFINKTISELYGRYGGSKKVILIGHSYGGISCLFGLFLHLMNIQSHSTIYNLHDHYLTHNSSPSYVSDVITLSTPLSYPLLTPHRSLSKLYKFIHSKWFLLQDFEVQMTDVNGGWNDYSFHPTFYPPLLASLNLNISGAPTPLLPQSYLMNKNEEEENDDQPTSPSLSSYLSLIHPNYTQNQQQQAADDNQICLVVDDPYYHPLPHSSSSTTTTSTTTRLFLSRDVTGFSIDHRAMNWCSELILNLATNLWNSESNDHHFTPIKEEEVASNSSSDQQHNKEKDETLDLLSSFSSSFVSIQDFMNPIKEWSGVCERMGFGIGSSIILSRSTLILLFPTFIFTLMLTLSSSSFQSISSFAIKDKDDHLSQRARDLRSKYGPPPLSATIRDEKKGVVLDIEPYHSFPMYHLPSSTISPFLIPHVRNVIRELTFKQMIKVGSDMEVYMTKRENWWFLIRWSINVFFGMVVWFLLSFSNSSSLFPSNTPTLLSTLLFDTDTPITMRICELMGSSVFLPFILAYFLSSFILYFISLILSSPPHLTSFCGLVISSFLTFGPILSHDINSWVEFDISPSILLLIISLSFSLSSYSLVFYALSTMHPNLSLPPNPRSTTRSKSKLNNIPLVYSLPIFMFLFLCPISVLSPHFTIETFHSFSPMEVGLGVSGWLKRLILCSISLTSCLVQIWSLKSTISQFTSLKFNQVSNLIKKYSRKIMFWKSFNEEEGGEGKFSKTKFKFIKNHKSKNQSDHDHDHHHTHFHEDGGYFAIFEETNMRSYVWKNNSPTSHEEKYDSFNKEDEKEMNEEPSNNDIKEKEDEEGGGDVRIGPGFKVVRCTCHLIHPIHPSHYHQAPPTLTSKYKSTTKSTSSSSSSSYSFKKEEDDPIKQMRKERRKKKKRRGKKGNSSKEEEDKEETEEEIRGKWCEWCQCDKCNPSSHLPLPSSHHTNHHEHEEEKSRGNGNMKGEGEEEEDDLSDREINMSPYPPHLIFCYLICAYLLYYQIIPPSIVGCEIVLVVCVIGMILLTSS